MCSGQIVLPFDAETYSLRFGTQTPLYFAGLWYRVCNDCASFWVAVEPSLQDMATVCSDCRTVRLMLATPLCAQMSQLASDFLATTEGQQKQRASSDATSRVATWTRPSRTRSVIQAPLRGTSTDASAFRMRSATA